MNWRRWLTLGLSRAAEPTEEDVSRAVLTPEEIDHEEQQKRLLREQLDRASETLRHLEIQWGLRGQGTTRRDQR